MEPDISNNQKQLSLLGKDNYSAICDIYSISFIRQALIVKGFGGSSEPYRKKDREGNASNSKNELIKAANLFDQGHLKESEKIYRDLISRKVRDYKCYGNLAKICALRNKWGEVKLLLEKALSLNNNYIDAYNLLGIFYKNNNKIEEAIETYTHALSIKPDHPEVLNNLSNALRLNGDLDSAIEFSRKALLQRPDYSDALHNLGVCFLEKENFKLAIDYFNKALLNKQDNAALFFSLGNAMKETDELELAIENYNKAISLQPNFPEALNNLGKIYLLKENHQTAMGYFKEALEYNPNLLEALNNLGDLYKYYGDIRSAIDYYQKIISSNPNESTSLDKLGASIREQGDLIGSINFYRKALVNNPNSPELLNGIGISLAAIGDIDSAINSYKRAIILDPIESISFYNLGNTFLDKKAYLAAIAAYKEAIYLNPNFSEAKASIIQYEGHICDWSEISLHQKWLETLGIEGGAISRLGFIPLEDDPLKQLIRAKRYFEKKYANKKTKAISIKSNEKIHIGYFSANFNEHPVMHLLSRVFELHDKSKFEIYAYSYGSKEDNYTRRVKSSVYKFKDIRGLSDLDAVSLARADHLDIAVDLMGYTKDNRFSIFSHRVSPIQISYLGYPASTGSNCIDYIIADQYLIPKGNEKYYSEKVIHMPNCYQCNDNTIKVSEKKISRDDLSLPEKSFVFTCFNASYKITKRQFDIWMRLLQKIDNSVLWLFKSNLFAETNLRKEAIKSGIDSNRLIFAERIKLSEHLSRHKYGDLFLDTFNYTAGATAWIALRAGLPLLTLAGKGYTARMSSSLLKALDLQELITETEEEYEDVAYSLATQKDKLSSLRLRLKDALQNSSLFDSALFTRNLEEKYVGLCHSEKRGRTNLTYKA